MERNPKTYVAPTFASDSALAEPGSSYDLMLRFIGRDKRVLEFGCASGYMSRMLSLSGCRVTGIEYNPAAAAEARHYCEDVLVADLDTRKLDDVLPETTFDVAVFGDVLEHLRDPWRVLDDARRFVAPGGFVVLSIPNIAHGSVRLSLLSGAFNYKEAGLLDDTHIRFFTLNGIIDLCLRAGYRIDTIDRTRMPIFSDSPYLPNVSREEFDPVTVDRVCQDPEAETFQFVVKAIPLDDAAKREAVYKEFLRIRSELEDLRRHVRAGHIAAPIVEDEAAVAKTSREIDELHVEIETMREEIERMRAESSALASERVDLQNRYEDMQHRLSSEASEARARLEVERDENESLLETARNDASGDRARIDLLEADRLSANEYAASLESRLAEAAVRGDAAEAARMELMVEHAELRIDLADRIFERDVALEGRERAEAAVSAAHAEAGVLREKLATATAALSAGDVRATARYEELQAQLQFVRAEFERRNRLQVESDLEASRVAAAFAELGPLHRHLSDVAAERLALVRALEEEIETLRSELATERERGAAAHVIFSEYLSYEIANARHQTTTVDRMIETYYSTKWWSLKRLLARRGRKARAT